MKICPKCGHRDNPFWRYSRFDYNTEYMEIEEFPKQYPKIWEKLKDVARVEIGELTYYKRGRKRRYIYRVLTDEYKVPRK